MNKIELEEINKIDIVDIINKTSGNNKYQYKIFLFFLFFWLVDGIVISSPAFLFILPDIEIDNVIKNQNTTKIVLKQVTRSFQEQDCQEQSFEFKKKNFAVEFDIFCERKIYEAYFQSSVFVGNIFGGLIFSYLSVLLYIMLQSNQKDQKGRSVIIKCCSFASTFAILLFMLSQTISTLIILQFFIGMLSYGCYLLTMIVMNEICSDIFRQNSQILLNAMYYFGELLTSILFFFEFNWRIVYVIAMVFSLLFMIGTILYLKETPQFLLNKNQIVELQTVFTEVSQQNNTKEEFEVLWIYIIESHSNVQQFKNQQSDQIFICADKCYNQINESKQFNIIDPQFQCFLSLLLCIITCSQGKYNTTLIIIKILVYTAYNRYHMGILFILQNFACRQLDLYQLQYQPIIYRNLKEKKFFFIVYHQQHQLVQVNLQLEIMVQIFCQFYIYFLVILLLVFATVFKFVICLGFSVLPVFINETFPTNIRSQAAAIAYGGGLLGAATSPYLLQYTLTLNVSPFLGSFIFSVLTIAIIFPLQETHGQKIPQNKEDFLSRQIK